MIGNVNFHDPLTLTIIIGLFGLFVIAFCLGYLRGRIEVLEEEILKIQLIISRWRE